MVEETSIKTTCGRWQLLGDWKEVDELIEITSTVYLRMWSISQIYDFWQETLQ